MKAKVNRIAVVVFIALSLVLVAAPVAAGGGVAEGVMAMDSGPQLCIAGGGGSGGG